jgi:pimeloyl-ACP methyl ester carboxylesterase
MNDDIRRGYVWAGDLQIHYREAGEGHPVLLLHQSPSSSLMYQGVLPFFAAAGMRAIAIDTPGFGMSDRPKPEPTIEDYAATVRDVLDGFGFDRVDLVGFHTGATVCWEVAGAYPDRVRRLAVSGAGLYTPEERAAFTAGVERERQRNQPRPDGSHILETWQSRVRVSPADTWILHQEIVQNLVAGETAWWGHRAAFAYNVEPRVRSVHLPIIIVTNTGDMIHKQALRTAELRPDARLVVLEGGTTDIVIERPEEWSRPIIEFLLEPDEG